jgi:hypothetical protein
VVAPQFEGHSDSGWFGIVGTCPHYSGTSDYDWKVAFKNMTNPTFAGETIPDLEDEGFAAPPEAQQQKTIVKEMGLDEPVELTEEETEIFGNLLFIGRKSKIISIAGHRILIETLTTDVELQLGLITKEFQGSDGYARAYKAAIVAASIREVDGRPLYQSLSSDESDDVGYVVRKKFEKIQKYYPVLIETIYNKIVEMEKELFPLMEKLKKTLC